jgi:hypothetical protein
MLRSSLLALTAVSLAVLALPARAVPTTIAYAGFLTNNGAPVDGTVDLVIELFDDRTGGAALFSESFQSVIVPDGDLVVELGTVTPLDDSILDSAELWLQATVDGEVMLPRARLASVPYALQAGEAASLEGLTASDIQSQIDALAAQITAAQTQLSSLQASLTGLASAGGASVAFANVTGLAFQSPLVFTGGNATVSANGITATHIATDGVGAAEIAASAVGTSEIADGSITRADILPTDLVQVWADPKGCVGGEELHLAAPPDCTSVSCTGDFCVSAPCYKTCNGICTDAAAGFTCPAVWVGLLIDND